jgi:hypothetical protein
LLVGGEDAQQFFLCHGRRNYKRILTPMRPQA